MIAAARASTRPGSRDGSTPMSRRRCSASAEVYCSFTVWNGQGAGLAQRREEGLHRPRLRPDAAVERHGHPGDDGRRLVLAGEPEDRLDAAPRGAPVDGGEGRRKHAGGVAEGDADAAITDVEAQGAGHGG